MSASRLTYQLSNNKVSVFLLDAVPHRNFFFFFFNDTATTEIYTLSLHDALPISVTLAALPSGSCVLDLDLIVWQRLDMAADARSEEHTSELQSRLHLVCRLLLEKKKTTQELRARESTSSQHTKRRHVTP